LTADTVEDLQLDMAADLLAHSRAYSVQLRFLGDRTTEALRGVVRIAHSRGARLPASEPEERRAGDPREGAAER
jgi:hypothetical protein